MIFSFILLSLIKLGHGYTTEALADRITKLPGAENLNIEFNQFSGYLEIPGSEGASKFIHYWFVESMNNPASDPLAFWTNGGPGCSGLIGFMTEQGPFKPEEDGTLRMNPYAWNQVANMVFIEAPAGVGFSYAQNTDDYNTGDKQTAIDNYNTIQAFLKRFPEYQTNDLYITSESYGGHYMPTLAKKIVDENTAGNNPVLNFKGLAVGNPLIDAYSYLPAAIDTFWGHQLASKPSYDLYKKECTEGNLNSDACVVSALNVYVSYGSLNPYALDYPICTESNSALKAGRSQRTWMANQFLKAKKLDTDAKVRQILAVPSIDTYEPCAINYATDYLNRDDVKEAIHVNSTIVWAECSSILKYSPLDFELDMVPIYKYLIDGGYGLKILVYSGDDDSVCATVGTQHWIWNMGYRPQPGAAWVQQILDGQPVGYLAKFEASTKLAFLTVHGAGHEVPTYKPAVALNMFASYLKGTYTGN